MTERNRTILLIALLIIAVGFIIWTQGEYQNNFVDQL